MPRPAPTVRIGEARPLSGRNGLLIGFFAGLVVMAFLVSTISLACATMAL